MIRKQYLYLIFAAAISLAVQLTAYSQYQPVNGTVVLEKDGKTEPVAGALIEVYRIDVKAGFPSTKTNKKGEFNFAGVPYGNYVFSVSAPGCAPTLFPVKSGEEKLVIKMNPGDGHKFTEAEARKGVAEATKSGDANSAADEEENRKRAEDEKKNAEIDARNKKVQNADAVALKSNSEGKAALDAENYDLAIAKYSEGVDAVPDFVGSTPIMLTGKMLALKGKGYKIYKEGATSSDTTTKTAKYADANKLYDDALAAFQPALAVIKAAPPTTDAVELKRREATTLNLYAAATEVHRLKAGLDPSKIAEASTVFAEYIAMLTDPAKKIDAQMALGETMRRAFDFAKAVEAYRQILAVKQDHAEATGWLGLSLFGLATATETENKEMEQEGLNYMQKYTEMSPVSPTDPPAVKELKESIKQTVDYLRSQKMAPQKVTPPTRTTAAPKKRN